MGAHARVLHVKRSNLPATNSKKVSTRSMVYGDPIVPLPFLVKGYFRSYFATRSPAHPQIPKFKLPSHILILNTYIRYPSPLLPQSLALQLVSSRPRFNFKFLSISHARKFLTYYVWLSASVVDDHSPSLPIWSRAPHFHASHLLSTSVLAFYHCSETSSCGLRHRC